MIWTHLTLAASKIAFSQHLNQVDKLGVPYIFHLMAVAERCPDDVTGAMGLLHDLAEDVPAWKDFDHDSFIRQIMSFVPGLPMEAAEGLWLLKHPKNMPYQEYVQRICDSGNRLPLIVKKADLEVNMDPNRQAMLDQETSDRLMAKYNDAYRQVNAALEK